MIVKRYNTKEVVLLRDKLLVKSNGEIEEILPKIPLPDICLLTGISKEDIKRDYRNIQDWYDSSIVELMLDNCMVEQPYYKSCKVIAFESALIYNIYFDTEKIDLSLDSDFLPIPIAASILFLSEEAMLRIAKNEIKVYNEEYFKVSDFMDYYKGILKERGIQADITLVLKKECISILVERQLNDNHMN